VNYEGNPQDFIKKTQSRKMFHLEEDKIVSSSSSDMRIAKVYA
jgi:hypothetical protein